MTPETADTDGGASLHRECLHRLVAGAGACSTAELHLLYEAVAPLVYRGTTVSSVESRRWRRELLTGLVDARVLTAHDTPRGRVLIPRELPEGMAVNHTAREARESRVDQEDRP